MPWEQDDTTRGGHRTSPMELRLRLFSCGMDNVLRALFICSFLAMLMDRHRIHFLTAVIILSVFLLGFSIYVVLDSDFGRVEVNIVLIADGGIALAGLLYRPVSASTLSPVPAFVLALSVGETADCAPPIFEVSFQRVMCLNCRRVRIEEGKERGERWNFYLTNQLTCNDSHAKDFMNLRFFFAQ